MNITRRMAPGPKSLTMEYRAGQDGMEPDAGNGVSVVSNEDGSIQLAVYWTDDEGKRHTIHICETEPKLLPAIAVAIESMSDRARRQEDGATVIRLRAIDTRTTH